MPLPALGRRRSRWASPASRGALAVVAAGLAGAAAYLLRRGDLPRPTDGAARDEAHVEWHCACGQGFRVNGTDRHRVLWLPDAGPEDPLLDDRCPSCDRELSTQG